MIDGIQTRKKSRYKRVLDPKPRGGKREGAGRPPDQEKHTLILSLLDEGLNWREVSKKVKTSSAQISRVVHPGGRKRRKK